MGCICSLEDLNNARSGRKNNFESEDYTGGKAHPLVTENANHNQKAKALEVVKKNDAILMQKVLEEVNPAENIGMPGDNYTVLHAAAEFNSFQAMSILTSWLKANRAEDMDAIMNITDTNGNTPAMLCVKNNSGETFYILLKKGLVGFKQIMQIKQKLYDVDQKNSKNCLTLIEKQVDNSQPQQQAVDGSDKYKVDEHKEAAHKEMDAIIAKVEKLKEDTKQEVKDIAGGVDAEINLDDNNKVSQIIKNLTQSGGIFIDKDFPANVNSLSVDPHHESYAQFKNAKWKRPHELFQCDYDQIQLFDNIDPNDIAQGILGVCYFLSSLSAIAEFPSRLTKVFLNKTSNKFGAYGLRFYVRGVPTEVVVDDLIPCYGDRKNTPLFSRPKGKELWVLLAEKAWGKLYKNYAACEAGIMSEAFEYLLGCPSVNYSTDSQTVDEIWDIISSGDNEKHIMGAGTQADVKEEWGLVAGHAYSVISAHQLGNNRVLKLRNPWGSFEWKGDFSDNSPLWTDEYKRKVGFTNADDGVFFMKVEDFKTMFGQYDVCMYNEGWEYTYSTVDSVSNHADYFRVTADHPCEAYFRIHQDDKRNLSVQEQENFRYSAADLIVAYVEEDGTYTPVVENPDDVFNIINVRSTFASKYYKVQFKKAGTYIIRTKVRWENKEKNTFTLSSYASTKLELHHVAPIKNFLRGLFINSAKFGTKKEMKNNCSGVYENYSNYSYLFFKNDGPKTWLLDITFTALDNLKIAKSAHAAGNNVKLTIPPGGKELVYLKSVDAMQGTSYGWKFSYRFQ